ncbi:GumC family protein [Pontibacter oryzae]|uniref:Polysaccharide chain length determinant N-terminal domain-containing protein n=1 Tax=Pontibacter oryzae TaxID=2304593 RepID=A0A399SL71_9BACT|nr:hypothetical protein [Pontibacter oryzae]RIJ42525.1 hypothetical protein D1627_01280 [Pontibacter oryzae]
MTFLRLLRILLANRRLLVLLPLAMAVTVFLLTRDGKKSYVARTMIYTGLASGYTLESGGDSRIDYFSVNNAFDNLINMIKARSTLEETGVRLLAEHLMMPAPDPYVCSEATLVQLNERMTTPWQEQLRKKSVAETEKELYRVLERQDKRLLEIIHGEELPYSLKGIQANLKVERQGSSDMVMIAYTAEDPAVAKRTVELLCQVFMHRYKDIKVGETGSVVAYFEEQLKFSLDRLNKVEADLKSFSSDNRIINFYEQSKIIASQERDINLAIEEEKSSLVGLEAALQDLEKKLSSRTGIATQSSLINKKRLQLTELQSQLTMLQMNQNLEANLSDVSRLNGRITGLEQELRADVADLYGRSFSTQGVPTDDLFNRWMDALISFDKSRAKVEVLSDIREEYVKQYDIFAPLGSGLNKLERQVGVAEREYLENLHSLNMSRLREQNLQLSTNLKMVDQPAFPTEPEPSKRLVLVIAAFMGGVVLSLGYVLGKELLDTSVRSPQRATTLTGLPFAGASAHQEQKDRRVHLDLVEDKLLNQLISTLQTTTKAIPHGETICCILFSLHASEGKSSVGEKLVAGLQQIGERAHLLVPEADQARQTSLVSTYKQRQSINKPVKALDDVISVSIAPNNYTYLFLEIPAVADHVLPLELIQQAQLSLLVLDADRRWGNADKFSLGRYLDVAKHPAHVVLNKVQTEFLYDIIGEIPKKRSWLRRIIKEKLTR